jgi:lipopolysaccharide biosynthesis glycosyltransferase
MTSGEASHDPGSRPALVLAGDEKYVPGLYVSLVSALSHLPTQTDLDVVVIDEGLSPTTHRDLKELVTKAAPCARLLIAPGVSSTAAAMPTSGHITQATYGRLLVPGLRSSARRALYLDADTLTRSDIGELLNLQLGGAAVGGVVDADIPTQVDRQDKFGCLPRIAHANAPYINAGVLLMALDRWRDEGLAASILGYIEANGSHLRFHDQDAINVELAEDLKVLDGKWNYQLRVERTRADEASLRRAAILHFSDVLKPWATLEWLRQGPVARQAGAAWWKVALFSAHLPLRFRTRMALRLIANGGPFLKLRLSRWVAALSRTRSGS